MLTETLVVHYSIFVWKKQSSPRHSLYEIFTMKLSRDVTQFLVRMFDNCIPPIIRDSLWCMYIPIRLVRGNKWRVYTTFRDRIPFLTDNEYRDIYTEVQSVELNRETDTNSRCIEEIQKNIAGTTILDAGCGRGYLSRLLAKNYAVTGIDIACAQSYTADTNPVLLNGSLESLPFPDKAFDTVVCAHTLEHVLNFERVVSELRRVTRHRLLIIVPIQRPYRYTFDLHVRFFPTIESFQYAMRRGNDSECRNVGGDIFYKEDRID